MANGLIAKGVRRQDRVALCLRRTHKAVVAILGSLKADAVYVPLDPKSPIERQLQVLADCRPAALVCDARTQDVAQELARRSEPGCPVVCLDRIPADSADERPVYRNVETDLAYILYTSGSTGRPKGVMVSHRNVVDYASWAVGYFGITGEDRILGTAPFHFDMSTFDIFSALKGTARLCVAPEDFLLFPRSLVRYVEEQGVTLWKTVPSLFVYMARAGCLKPGGMGTLTRLLFGGEALHPRNLAQWMRLYPEKAFYNVYGPTEATGVSLCHAVTSIPGEGQLRVPIGRACANTEAFALRTDGGVAGPGETGELHIRGAGVAQGYWGDPEKTRAAFVPNPLGPGREERVYRTGDLVTPLDDGGFEFVGRNDEQVKYMGYRISTSDIEAALVSIAGVSEAAVYLDESEGLIAPELVALVQCEPEQGPAELGRQLARRLPAYMVPKRIVPVPRIPRTDRGKIARRELRELGRGGKGPAAVVTIGKEEVEEILASVLRAKGSSEFFDVHVHPFDVIFQGVRYARASAQDDVYGSGDFPFGAPEPAPVRLRGPAVPPESYRPAFFMIPVRRLYRHTGPRVLGHHMALAGIDRALLLPVAPASGTDDGGMDAIEQMFGGDPRFLLALSVPNSVATGGIGGFIGRAVSTRRVRAVKLHPGITGIDLGSREGRERVEAMIDGCRESRTPLVVHGGRSYPLLDPGAQSYACIRNLAAIRWRDARVPVAIAHAGSYGCSVDEVEREVMPTLDAMLSANDNLFVDISALEYEALVVVLRQVGTDRVLFGSDALYESPSSAMVKLVSALKSNRMDPEGSVKKIAGLNPARFLAAAPGEEVSRAEKGVEESLAVARA